MARFAVNISDIENSNLEFFGYQVVDENDEFKIVLDKNLEHHIIQKAYPFLYVEDINDAVYLSAKMVIALPEK